MEPLAALGVASNIIQIVDFASRLVSRSQELYQSADGKLADHNVLDSAAQNLSTLCDELRDLGSKTSRLNTADVELVKLQADSEAVVDKLQSALNRASLGSKHKKWQSVYQALKSIYNEKEISSLANQLDNIRKQVDTTLLVSIRQQFDSSAEEPSFDQYHSTRIDRKKLLRDEKLLKAVHTNDWQASDAKDVEEFSQQLRSNTSTTLKEQFCSSLLPRLYFQQMANRSEIIPEAHRQTFGWIFDSQHSFHTWLQREDSSLYWIAGKPGSGKSTLMKFLYSHDNLRGLLDSWARSRGSVEHVTKAGFYFWNSGSTMQMSRLGLLRTLLHSCIGEDADLGLIAFPERWKQFAAFGGGQEPWDWLELKRAFENVISDHSRLFFILIDGLDEFDGEPKEIIQLVLGAARPNVKVCVASRPWLPFEDAFKDQPSLLLEDLTRRDISTYVSGYFRNNEHYIRLQLDEPDEADRMIQSIAEKALGVFLWVNLVVQSLLEGLSNSDRLKDLQARIDALPSDLEALFDNLLRRLGSVYYTQACQIFYLLRVHRDILAKHAYDTGALYSRREYNFNTPSLLGMYFADDDNLVSSISAPWKALDMADAFRKSENMRRRLVARCNGFLETTNPGSNRPAFDHEIVYLHRTARDYVESDAYWPTVLQTAGHHAFMPAQRWSNANLWLYKVHPLIGANWKTWDHDREKSKIECAWAIMWIEEMKSEPCKAYLDAMVLEDPDREVTGLRISAEKDLVFFDKVRGLYEYYSTFYLQATYAGLSAAEQMELNEIDEQYRRPRTVALRESVQLEQHEHHSILRYAGYYKARRGIKRLRRRPTDA